MLWDKYEVGYFVSEDQLIVKTSGRLPNVNGHEGSHLRFHGRTIFLYVETGKIWIENQVSLKAGENVPETIRFE